LGLGFGAPEQERHRAERLLLIELDEASLGAAVFGQSHDDGVVPWHSIELDRRDDDGLPYGREERADIVADGATSARVHGLVPVAARDGGNGGKTRAEGSGAGEATFKSVSSTTAYCTSSMWMRGDPVR